MKINLRSTVTGYWKDVFDSFDKQLFLFLLPPGAKLQRFDGSQAGDIVHIHFSFPPGTEWISRIVSEHRENGHAYFVDIGEQLPFGLTEWKHKHHVYEAGGRKAMIVDEIHFSTGSLFKDLIFYPFLYAAFLPRTWQYKQYFSRRFSADREAI